jgi:hypothetical protein
MADFKVGDEVVIVRGHNSVKGKGGKITSIVGNKATVLVGYRSVDAPLASIQPIAGTDVSVTGMAPTRSNASAGSTPTSLAQAGWKGSSGTPPERPANNLGLPLDMEDSRAKCEAIVADFVGFYHGLSRSGNTDRIQYNRKLMTQAQKTLQALQKIQDSYSWSQGRFVSVYIQKVVDLTSEARISWGGSRVKADQIFAYMPS